MLKKIWVWMVVWVVFSLGEVRAQAVQIVDRSGAWWSSSERATCLSVIDPENLPDGYFLVFDYDSEVGKFLGEPWAVVEKGKCYEIKNSSNGFGQKIYNGGTLYVVKGGEEEKKKLGNYPPEANLMVESVYGDGNVVDIGLEMIEVYSGDSRSDVVFGAMPLSSTTADFSRKDGNYYDRESLMPTRHWFGFGITSHYSKSFYGRAFDDYMATAAEMHPDFETAEDMLAYDGPREAMIPLLNDPRYFQELYQLYNELAENLKQTIQNCDRREKIEIQFSVEPQDMTVIWHLRDGSQWVARDYYLNESLGGPSSLDHNVLDKVSGMGCATAYRDFVLGQAAAIKRIDDLAVELAAEYKIVLSDFYNESIMLNALYDDIQAYVQGNYQSDFVLEEYKDKREWLHSFHWLRQYGNWANEQNALGENGAELTGGEQLLEATELDQPTSERKIGLARGNKWLWVYMMLPVVAIVGIVGIGGWVGWQWWSKKKKAVVKIKQKCKEERKKRVGRKNK